MSLFRKNKDVGIASFVLKLVNNNCPDMKVGNEDPRTNSRVRMVVVVRIIPMEDKRLQVDRAFTTVTKEFSNTGVAVVLDQPRGLKEAVLGFRLQDETVFIRAEAKHLNPMGGGFFQLGFRLKEKISPGDYPELKSVYL